MTMHRRTNRSRGVLWKGSITQRLPGSSSLPMVLQLFITLYAKTSNAPVYESPHEAAEPYGKSCREEPEEGGGQKGVREDGD